MKSFYHYEKKGVNTNRLIPFIATSYLPSAIFQISKVIGKKKAIEFYLKAEGKQIYIPQEYRPDLAIHQYLGKKSVKSLIEAMPGQRVDFREKTTSLRNAFAAAYRAYLGKEYKKRYLEFKLQFMAQHQLSESIFRQITK